MVQKEMGTHSLRRKEELTMLLSTTTAKAALCTNILQNLQLRGKKGFTKFRNATIIQMIADMRRNNWIDFQTKAIIGKFYVICR